MTIALQGDFGKPRPALVIQANPFNEHTSVTVLPVTSTLVTGAPVLRINVWPSEANGLNKPSQIMIDKTMTVMRDKVGPVFGHLDPDAMIEVDRLLAVFLGIA